MSISTEQRLKKRNEIIEEIQEIYSTPEAGQFYQKIFTRFDLNTEQYPQYINTIGDTILGFYKTTDLPRLFQQELGLGADDAQRMTSELLEFLSPVVAREGESSKIKKEDLDKLAATFEAANNNRPKEIRPEGRPADVKPLRTMNADMDRIHGYGAYRDQFPHGDDEPVVQAAAQEDLLTPPPPSAPRPDLTAPPPTDPNLQNVPINRVP